MNLKWFVLLIFVGLIVSVIAFSPDRSAAQVSEYYAASDGVYDAPGTIAAPTTLVGARDKIRAMASTPTGGITVYLRGGVYELEETFSLTHDDSGTAVSPITYRAYQDETVRVSGGRQLDPGWLTAVTDSSPIWDRLNPAAQGNVYQINFTDYGITDFGTLNRRGFSEYSPTSALELVFNNEMMELARWPNREQTDSFDEDAPTIVTGNLSPAVDGTYEFIGRTASGNVDDGFPNYRRNGLVDGVQYYLYHCTWGEGGVLQYWFISPHSPVDDPDCWPTDSASWWGHATMEYPIPLMTDLANASGDAVIRSQPEDYAADGFLRIPERMDDTTFRFPGNRYQNWIEAPDIWFQGLFAQFWADDSLAGTVDSSGTVTLAAEPSYGVQESHPFFALNLLEEIDIPGEYYLDRGTGFLYFWPPANLNGSDIAVSLLEDPLLQIDDAAYINFESIVFELGREDLVKINDGESIHFSNCTFRNTGADGLDIYGSNNRIADSLIYNTGATAVRLEGGDRPSLTAGANMITNSEIHHFGRWDRTYRPAVYLRGVGQIITHNDIHDAPHSAIIFSGNEHQIAYNEISHVVKEANDAGAIYTGRDWGYRGNEINYNFFHHVQSVFGGADAVYLDDAVSGITVYGNIIYEVTGYATQSGGGRDNIFRNNILVNTDGGHLTDRRAQSAANNQFDGNGRPDDWNLLGRINVDYNTFYNNFPDLPTIDYQSGVWASTYPALAAIPNDWLQVDNSHWLDPEGSVFACNVARDIRALLRESTWGGSGALDMYADTSDNLIADPLFVDEANLDMNLQSSSPAYSLNCFEEIPFDLIGVIDYSSLTQMTYLPVITNP